MVERGSVCQRCNLESPDPDTFTVDHIIPRKMGFKYGWYVKENNKQLLCARCNNTKEFLESALRRRFGHTRKNLYIMLLNGYANPLEAVTAEQGQLKN